MRRYVSRYVSRYVITYLLHYSRDPRRRAIGSLRHSFTYLTCSTTHVINVDVRSARYFGGEGDGDRVVPVK